MIRHPHTCTSDDCTACQSRAEERKAARDEGMSEYEEQERDNSYQRDMERGWGA